MLVLVLDFGGPVGPSAGGSGGLRGGSLMIGKRSSHQKGSNFSWFGL